MYEDKLPETLHELVTLAHRDMQHVETLPGYRIDMATWHEFRPPYGYDGEGACSVCLAGSLLTMEYGMPDYSMLVPAREQRKVVGISMPQIELSPRLWDKMRAVNLFRQGMLAGAYRHLYGERLSNELWSQIYGDNEYYRDEFGDERHVRRFPYRSYKSERLEFLTQLETMIQICRDLDI